MATLTDEQLLDAVLEPPYVEKLREEEPEIFEKWRSVGKLSDKQKAWLRDAAERTGLQVAGAANLFSKLSPAEQERQRAKAAKVKLPWE